MSSYMPLPGSEMLISTVKFKRNSRRRYQKRICQGHVKNSLSEKLISETQRKMETEKQKRKINTNFKVQRNETKSSELVNALFGI